MHYIRFLKPPRTSQLRPRDRTSVALLTKITISSDLGETFLNYDLPVESLVVDSKGGLAYRQVSQWKSDSRELDISIPLSQLKHNSLGPYRLVVRSGLPAHQVRYLQSVLDSHAGGNASSSGLVVQALSAPFITDLAPVSSTIYRTFNLDAANPHAKLTIEEDTGHSIARHIWDAGLVLSARLHEICSSSTTQVSRAADGLRLLYERLRRDGHKPLKVLELGTGCGLVAATLAHSINSSKVECITATDLPDAEAIATANLTLAGSDKLGYANLDWSEPLPDNVSSTTYDLVLVADCTYNSDVVPYLVKTLAKLVTGKDTLICLAMKVRHDSEAIFFDLMEEKHLKIVGKHTDILKDLNGPDQNIHTYLFQHEGAVRG